MRSMFDLNFFSSPLKKDFSYPIDSDSINFRTPHSPLTWVYFCEGAAAIANPDIVSWARDNALRIQTIVIFKTAPNQIPGIHTDGIKDYLAPAINWVLTGFPSEQIYYTPATGLLIDDCLLPNIEAEENNSYYRQFDEAKMVEIERKTIIGPTLVRIDQPHRIANYSDEHRLTISMRFEKENGEFFSSWDEIVTIFKKHLK